jgi:hypothetical protein
MAEDVRFGMMPFGMISGRVGGAVSTSAYSHVWTFAIVQAGCTQN